MTLRTAALRVTVIATAATVAGATITAPAAFAAAPRPGGSVAATSSNEFFWDKWEDETPLIEKLDGAIKESLTASHFINSSYEFAISTGADIVADLGANALLGALFRRPGPADRDNAAWDAVDRRIDRLSAQIKGLGNNTAKVDGAISRAQCQTLVNQQDDAFTSIKNVRLGYQDNLDDLSGRARLSDEKEAKLRNWAERSGTKLQIALTWINRVLTVGTAGDSALRSCEKVSQEQAVAVAAYSIGRYTEGQVLMANLDALLARMADDDKKAVPEEKMAKGMPMCVSKRANAICEESLRDYRQGRSRMTGWLTMTGLPRALAEELVPAPGITRGPPRIRWYYPKGHGITCGHDEAEVVEGRVWLTVSSGKRAEIEPVRRDGGLAIDSGSKSWQRASILLISNGGGTLHCEGTARVADPPPNVTPVTRPFTATWVHPYGRD